MKKLKRAIRIGTPSKMTKNQRLQVKVTRSRLVKGGQPQTNNQRYFLT